MSSGVGEEDKPATDSATKQAACLTCRKSKLKCNKSQDPTVTACTRCAQMSLVCEIPEYRVGRRKGTKNRYTGLEKSVRNIEQALENSGRQDRKGSIAGPCDPSRLEKLLEQAKEKLKVKRSREENDSEEFVIPPPAQRQYSISSDSQWPTAPPNFPSYGNMSYSSTSLPGFQASFQPQSPNLFQSNTMSDPSPTLSQTFMTPLQIQAARLPPIDTSQSFSAPAAKSEMNVHFGFSPPPLPPQPSSSHSNRQFHFNRIAHDSPGNRSQDTAQSLDSMEQVQGAENPLGLLAHVSSSLSKPPAGMLAPAKGKVKANDQFFGASSFRLDVKPELDPISLGLVTEEEANALVDTFHTRLSHTRWGLTSSLHTTSHMRKRSCLLLTAIMAGAAKFEEGHAAICKRLLNHQSKLIQAVMLDGYKSVEIVLGLMACIPWHGPGDNVIEDPTSLYIAVAMNIALDLSLDRIISDVDGNTSQFGPLSILSPKKALVLDGYPDVDPQCWYGRQLLRNRERAWLALFVLDRGFALARGRPPMVPQSAAILKADSWHTSSDADMSDASIAGAACLRRDMDQVIQRVKALSDQSKLGTDQGVDSIREAVDGYFDRWHKTWDSAIARGDSFPAYLDILIQHTKLSIYGSCVNYINATPEVTNHLCHSGLSAALNVMRAAVQGEHRLKSMPNNCCVMVSFAVCIVLNILSKPSAFGATLESSARILIKQVVDTLIRIGSTPSHRQGMSAVYGKLLKNAVAEVPFMHEGNSRPGTSGLQLANSSLQMQQATTEFGMHDTPLFSSMTDIQLQDAVGLQGPVFDLDAFNANDSWAHWLSGLEGA